MANRNDINKRVFKVLAEAALLTTSGCVIARKISDELKRGEPVDNIVYTYLPVVTSLLIGQARSIFLYDENIVLVRNVNRQFRDLEIGEDLGY